MYKDILRQAWQITWKHKYLWLFGLFASTLSSAGAGAWNMFVTNITRVLEQPELFDDINTLYTSDTLNYLLSNVSNFGSNPTFIALLGVIIAVVLIIAGVWLALTSQAALIKSTSLLSEGKASSLESDFTSGIESFWRLLGLFVLSQLAVYGVWFLLGFPLIAVAIVNSIPALATAFGVISFVIFVPLSLVVNLILVFASIYTVVNKTSIIESAYQGWQLFKRYWLTSLEFALVLFVINIVVVLFFVLLLAVPLVIVILLQSIASSYVLWSAIVTLITLLLIGAILTPFQFAATVIFVKTLSKKQTVSGFLSRSLTKIFRKEHIEI